MPRHAFRIVNVFAESPLAGNPLAVVEDGRGLDDATMQAIALQFNLSETTFVLPSSSATRRVRIWTPTFEMPFAGHPTLGTAHVVRELAGAGDSLTLEMKAGVIPVAARGDVWTFDAPAPKHREPRATREELAAMLGLDARDLGVRPLWVDTGSEQLIVPLASSDAVRRAAPTAEALARHANDGARAMHSKRSKTRIAPDRPPSTSIVTNAPPPPGIWRARSAASTWSASPGWLTARSGPRGSTRARRACAIVSAADCCAATRRECVSAERPSSHAGSGASTAPVRARKASIAAR